MNNMEWLVVRAQRFLTSRAGAGDRRFLYAGAVDSYDDGHYRMEFYVLEGSPPKGFIVADHAGRRVRAYDGTGTLLKVFQAKTEMGWLDKLAAEVPAVPENPESRLRLIARALLNLQGQLQTVHLAHPLGGMILEASTDMLAAVTTSLLLLAQAATPKLEATADSKDEMQKFPWHLRSN